MNKAYSKTVIAEDSQNMDSGTSDLNTIIEARKSVSSNDNTPQHSQNTTASN